MIRVTLWERDAVLKAGTIDYVRAEKDAGKAVLEPAGFVSEDVVRQIRSQLEEEAAQGSVRGYDWRVL
jgi:hypothetical protein